MARDDSRDDDRRDPRRSKSRLDIPRETRRSLVRRPHYDPDTFGNFAETFARFMGTARFLAYMTVFVVVWLTLNLVAIFGWQWDPYPFILLNLMFSVQAAYAGPVLMMSQNRAAERDRFHAQADADTNIKAELEIEDMQGDLSRIEAKLDRLLSAAERGERA